MDAHVMHMVKRWDLELRAGFLWILSAAGNWLQQREVSVVIFTEPILAYLSSTWGTQQGFGTSEDNGLKGTRERKRDRGIGQGRSTYRSYTLGSTGRAHILDQRNLSVGKLTPNTKPLRLAHNGTSHTKTPGNVCKCQSENTKTL